MCFVNSKCGAELAGDHLLNISVCIFSFSRIKKPKEALVLGLLLL